MCRSLCARDDDEFEVKTFFESKEIFKNRSKTKKFLFAMCHIFAATLFTSDYFHYYSFLLLFLNCVVSIFNIVYIVLVFAVL